MRVMGKEVAIWERSKPTGKGVGATKETDRQGKVAGVMG